MYMYGDFENIELKHPNIDMLRVHFRLVSKENFGTTPAKNTM